MRFALSVLMAVVCGMASAAPPVVPPKIEVKTGKSFQFQVKAKGGKKIGWAKTFPAGVVTLFRGHSDDASVYEYLLIGEVDGTYFIPFWTEGETTAAITTVVVGKGATEPPPVVDPPTDPTKPPVTGGKFFVMLIRPDGPYDDAQKAAELLPAWAELRAAGHQMKSYPESLWPKGFSKPAGVPAVLVVQLSADGKGSIEIGVKKRPTTDDEVKALLK